MEAIVSEAVIFPAGAYWSPGLTSRPVTWFAWSLSDLSRCRPRPLSHSFRVCFSGFKLPCCVRGISDCSPVPTHAESGEPGFSIRSFHCAPWCHATAIWESSCSGAQGLYGRHLDEQLYARSITRTRVPVWPLGDMPCRRLGADEGSGLT